jgi:hypothetical protein
VWNTVQGRESGRLNLIVSDLITKDNSERNSGQQPNRELSYNSKLALRCVQKVMIGFWESLSPNIQKAFILNIILLLIRVEAGSNTSTVTLRVVGGDEKSQI